ncbi:hypothetical protein BKA65DRAFT_718 [Rhexocercosporidium sp. MPI-PUGE-AT-0058]|nr:hypothetical protein BKA65DRAFT_718 [Rhexocercosporidium sp. MPI-PUGE-AT-0058]
MSSNNSHEHSKPEQDLQFLTFTDIAQTRDSNTKKKVRSHIQHRRQRNLGRGKQNNGRREVILDTSLLVQHDASSSYPADKSMGIAPYTPHPSDLGAGRSDPFVRYPIDMTIRTHELFDHLHGRDCSMFKTLSRIGFFHLVRDEAAFRQVLYTSSAHMASLRNSKEEDVEAISLSATATRSLSRLVADPVLCTGDAIIVSILAFACHCVMFNDAQGVLTHFHGLEEIIRRKGGMQVLGSDPVLRTMVFWLDVNASFLFDRPPRFAPPYDILPQLEGRRLTSDCRSPLLAIANTPNLHLAMADLLVLNRLLAHELEIRDLWDDGVFAGLHVVPVISKFLSVPPNAIEEDPAMTKQEACRLAALLYLAGVRQRFGVDLQTDRYTSKLKQCLQSLNWDGDDVVLLWLLFLGGVKRSSKETHDWFVSVMADLIVSLKYNFWDEVMAALKQGLWVDGLFGVDREKFRTEITSKLWETFEYWLH